MTAAVDEFAALLEVVHRTVHECAWNRVQTHASLAPYLIEESHEAVEALAVGTREDIVEELGDVLYSVVLHAELGAEDAQPYDIADIARALREKLVRRHPHVFAGVVAETPADVERVWNAVKAAEKSHRTSSLDGIPMAMPVVPLAQKLLSRAERAGVPLSAPAESAPAPAGPSPAPESVPAERAIGDRMLALVAEARAAGVDAEQAMRARLRSLADDIRAAERAAAS